MECIEGRSAPAAVAGIAALGLTCAALANPTEVVFEDLQICDPLFGPSLVDELGFMPPFPPDEWIEATWNQTGLVACPLTDDPAIPNVLVSMINLTGKAWTESVKPARIIHHGRGFRDRLGPTGPESRAARCGGTSGKRLDASYRAEADARRVALRRLLGAQRIPQPW